MAARRVCAAALGDGEMTSAEPTTKREKSSSMTNT